MSSRTLSLDDRLYDYLLANSLREPAVLAELRAETGRMAQGMIQISPEQGQFMQLLARLLGARRCLEIGTFTGYSSLAVALALPADGRILCCDVSEEFTQVARRYWAKAGVADKMTLALGPAAATLDAMLAKGDAGRFDMAFIDADKSSYDAYYERCLRLLRPGGLILIDNVLWSGDVADPAKSDADTQAIRALNAKLAKDERVDLSLLPVGDGLTLARKR
jgi:predicted O-methyltransferase YrrM